MSDDIRDKLPDIQERYKLVAGIGGIKAPFRAEDVEDLLAVVEALVAQHAWAEKQMKVLLRCEPDPRSSLRFLRREVKTLAAILRAEKPSGGK